MERSREMRILWLPMLVALVVASWCGVAAAETASWTLSNGAQAKVNELVRLDVKLSKPFDGRRLVVMEDGREVAYQIEVLEGALEAVHKGNIWVCTDLPAGASRAYTVKTGAQPREFKPRVKVTREGDSFVLDNGLVAVKVPAERMKLAGPIAGIRLAGSDWVGASEWRTTCVFNSLNPVVEGDGTIFGRVLLRYIFNDPNYGGPRVPFAYVTVTLKPGRREVEVEESFELTEGSAWVMELEGFRLKPRADKGGEFLAADQRQVIGVNKARAEKSVRADENAIRGRSDGGAQRVLFEFPANEGARCWLVTVGRATSP